MQTYRTGGGVCCRQILFDVDDNDNLMYCKFVHGCSGNQQGIARLVEGKNIDWIIQTLKGIPCKGVTSCPDQLARALEDYKERRKNGFADKKE